MMGIKDYFYSIVEPKKIRSTEYYLMNSTEFRRAIKGLNVIDYQTLFDAYLEVFGEPLLEGEMSDFINALERRGFEIREKL